MRLSVSVHSGLAAQRLAADLGLRPPVGAVDVTELDVLDGESMLDDMMRSMAIGF